MAERIAPNEKAQVARTIAEHPEIDSTKEQERGRIVDITARRLNQGGDKPWGRKSRSGNPENPDLNTDGLTFLRPDGNFEIYDVISGADGSATWDEWGPYKQGENGYWWPPGQGGSTPPTDEIKELKRQLAEVRSIANEAMAQAALAIPSDVPVALRTPNGYFIRVEGGGGTTVDATAPAAGPWETFRLKKLDGTEDFYKPPEPLGKPQQHIWLSLGAIALVLAVAGAMFRTIAHEDE